MHIPNPLKLAMNVICTFNGGLNLNLLHFKYAVEVAKAQSISKAAENLFMGQPNLSRAIRDLESSLGIVIFKRTTKGVSVTRDGEKFLHFAREIVNKADEVERIYKTGDHNTIRFSVCVPCSAYIASAFAGFVRDFKTDIPMELIYQETDERQAIDKLIKEDVNIIIIHYQDTFDQYFENLFYEKRLTFKTIAEYKNIILLSQTDPLAQKDDISIEDLSDYVELVHTDKHALSLNETDANQPEMIKGYIYTEDRASQYLLLESVAKTFMWTTPVPQSLLDRYSLLQKTCKNNDGNYKDVLVYRNDYHLSDMDKEFITQVYNAKRESQLLQ